MSARDKNRYLATILNFIRIVLEMTFVILGLMAFAVVIYILFG